MIFEKNNFNDLSKLLLSEGFNELNFSGFNDQLTSNDYSKAHYSYSLSNIFQRSFYKDNLTTWLTDIGSDKIYVALQENIAADPLAEYNKICTFLGIEHFDPIVNFDKIFTGNYTSEIEDSTVELLKPKFASDVAAIKDLYPSLDYSAWYDYS